jgi:hypothetical protein
VLERLCIKLPLGAPPVGGPVSDLQGVPLDPLVEIRICPAPADALIGPNRFVRDLKPDVEGLTSLSR